MTKKQYQICETSLNSKEYGRNCVVCSELGKTIQAEGRAHIIPQRLVERFGWLVIDHSSNFLPTCHKHNSTVQCPNDSWWFLRHIEKTFLSIVSMDTREAYHTNRKWVKECVDEKLR